MSLEAIEEIINKETKENKNELINYYIQIANERFDDGKSVDSKKIELILALNKFMTQKQIKELIEKVLNTKIIQVRSFILENFKDDFSIEKCYFGHISKWILAIIQEIKNTFKRINYEEKNKDILEIEKLSISEKYTNLSDYIEGLFHKKLIDEFITIFCSYKKFDSGGNQLLIDLISYAKVFPEFVDTEEILTTFEKHFQPYKCLDRDALFKLYEDIIKKS